MLHQPINYNTEHTFKKPTANMNSSYHYVHPNQHRSRQDSTSSNRSNSSRKNNKNRNGVKRRETIGHYDSYNNNNSNNGKSRNNYYRRNSRSNSRSSSRSRQNSTDQADHRRKSNIPHVSHQMTTNPLRMDTTPSVHSRLGHKNFKEPMLPLPNFHQQVNKKNSSLLGDAPESDLLDSVMNQVEGMSLNDSGHDNDDLPEKVVIDNEADDELEDLPQIIITNTRTEDPDIALHTETPLNTPWTLYVDKIPEPGASVEVYEQNLTKIYTVDSIEKFWQVFNNLPTPSMLFPKYSFHLMRGEERKPVWEDPLNENGGHWKMKCQKNNSTAVWGELLLAAVGEQFIDCVSNTVEDKIVGVSVSIRDKEDHFQIWNSNYKGASEARVIEKVKDLMGPSVKFHGNFYKEHNSNHDSGLSSKKRKNKSYRK